ncbi:heme-binding protein [Enterococcus sp. DIV0756]|uniref:heme-binding protein n=1 Tax=Enterococcus sp. DIV0756 TaxID=2774636 RepID=UPI003F298855
MTIEELVRQEKQLQFEGFDHELALAITLEIIDEVKRNFDKPVGIRVYYEDKTVVHYLMNGRKTSPWLDRKVKTVLESRHSSLYPFLLSGSHEEFAKWVDDPTHAICGGGFPIIVQGELKGAICVSGLDHLADHQIIINVLERVLNNQQVSQGNSI